MKVIWITDKELHKICNSFKSTNRHQTAPLGMSDVWEYNPLWKDVTIYLNTLLTTTNHPVLWEFVILLHERMHPCNFIPLSNISVLADDLWEKMSHKFLKGRIKERQLL